MEGLLCCAVIAVPGVGLYMGLRALLRPKRASFPARYRSSCPACQDVIEPGMLILYRKGEKARHANCARSKLLREDTEFAAILDGLARTKGQATRRNALRTGLARIDDPAR